MDNPQASDPSGNRAGRPQADPPASRKGIGRSQIAWLAIGGVLAVILVAILVLVFAPRPAPSVAGMWVGTGTVALGRNSQQIAVYLDLSTGANGQITGTGNTCVVAVTRNFTITGAPGSSNGNYTMQWTTTDPTGTTHTLHFSAHVSGSQMTISGSDPSTSLPITTSASLTHGSMNDYNAKCNSLPTPTPSS